MVLYLLTSVHVVPFMALRTMPLQQPLLAQGLVLGAHYESVLVDDHGLCRQVGITNLRAFAISRALNAL